MTGQRDQSSPDTTWPDGTVQQLAEVMFDTAADAQDAGSRATFVDLARAVLEALGPVITEHYVPRAKHEKLRADVLAAADDVESGGVEEFAPVQVAEKLRALVNEDTPTKETP